MHKTTERTKKTKPAPWMIQVPPLRIRSFYVQPTTFVAYQHMECVNSLCLTDVWGFHSLTESENLEKWIATTPAPNLERIVLLLILRKTCKPRSTTNVCKCVQCPQLAFGLTLKLNSFEHIWEELLQCTLGILWKFRK